FTSTPEEGGYVHYPEKVEGRKIRARSKSFMDYYSQPRVFWNSMSPVEKHHLIEALSFQIVSCIRESVRQQAVNILVNVDKELALTIGEYVGVVLLPGDYVSVSTRYASLSIANSPNYAYTHRVGVLIVNNVAEEELLEELKQLKKQGVFIYIISLTL